jgi:UDP-2,3-diacylglucosamine hydrolase
MKSWFFISDAHIRSGDQARQRLLVRFLEKNRDRMESLVILGDLFDFWFGFPHYVYPEYRLICDALSSLTQNGVRLLYIEGNHDFALGPFFKETLRGEVYPESHVFTIDGQKVYLAHGDMADPGDVRYRFYRALLKNPVVYSVIRFLGPEKTMRFKEALARRNWMHRRREHPDNAFPDLRFAEEKCREGMDVVILGHTHQPCEKTFVLNDRTCYYYNVGDWMENYSYLLYDQQSGFRLEYYQPEAGAPEEREKSASLYPAS